MARKLGVDPESALRRTIAGFAERYERFTALDAIGGWAVLQRILTADEVWSYIPGRGKPESVHLGLFPEERGEWTNERLAADWERLLEVRGEVSRALETARKQGLIGKGIDAVVYVTSAPEEQWRPLLAGKDPLAADPLPNLVLLDVMLPGASGFDVCRMLRATREDPAAAHGHPARGRTCRIHGHDRSTDQDEVGREALLLGRLVQQSTVLAGQAS